MNKNQYKDCTDLSICEKQKAGGKITQEQNHIKTERKLLIDINCISFRLDFPENEETVNK